MTSLRGRIQLDTEIIGHVDTVLTDDPDYFDDDFDDDFSFVERIGYPNVYGGPECTDRGSRPSNF